ncbi:MAG: hypothetical protein M1274_04045 [Actinobacteria bacterium]|nr:hypothetical protein [Actinomycetota bacterium]
MIRRCSVGERAVHSQIQGCLEVSSDLIELVVARLQLARDLQQRRGDALLLASQQLKWDGVFVVSLHELFALPLQFLPLSSQVGQLGI